MSRKQQQRLGIFSIAKEDSWKFFPFLCLAIVALSLVLAQAWGQEEEGETQAMPAEPVGLVLSFDNADLTEVIRVLAKTLTINVLIDPRVKGTVTIHTVDRIPKDQILPVLNEILKLNGFAMEKSGAVYKILPVEDAKQELPSIGSMDERVATDGSYAVRVYSLKYISRSSMSKIVQPFLSKGGTVAEIPRGNVLIVSDFTSNLRRVEELIALFDEAGFKSVKARILFVKNVDPEELSQELEGILTAIGIVGDGSEAVAVVPIPRLSTLLAIGSHDESLDQVEKWVRELDRVPEGGIQTYVYPVENSKAVDLANVLNQIYGGSGSTVPPSVTTRTRAPRTPTTGLGTRAIGSPLSNQGQSRQTTIGGGLAAVAQPQAQPGRPQASVTPPRSQTPGAFAPQRPLPPGGPTARRSAQEEPAVKIVADEVTNSLIIQAASPQYRGIREILKKLDIVPRQVLIEVLIAEVSLKNDLKFGIEYEFGRRRGDFTIGDSTTGTQRTFSPTATLLGTLPSTFPSGLTGTILDASRVKAILNALAEQNRVKVLSSPHILSADNRDAYIRVGDEVPILTQTQQAITGENTPIINNIQYRNTGVILAVTPQVNSRGLVNMIVSQEVSDVKEGTCSNATVGRDCSPEFFTRATETNVVVQNGETLVIGGIIKDTAGQGMRGIPYLMDIPIIGRLFRLTTNTSDRTELIVLITPHVVRDRLEARKVTSEFLKKVETIRQRLKKEEIYPPLVDSTELPDSDGKEEPPVADEGVTPAAPAR